MTKGISVIICCFNSEKRLDATLQALSGQKCAGMFNWEVLIVDNASSDNTSRKALEFWKKYVEPAQLRVIREDKPGLTNARRKGILSAQYEYLLFCDDDNWLNPDYLRIGYDTLEKYPEVAALGGTGTPVFESEKPDWFDEFKEAYAVGSQSITIENGKQLSLYGAGMFIRKSMYFKIVGYGFQELLNDRTGNSLSSSGDTELTNAFTIAGYDLMSSDKLHFQHFLTSNRLQRKYLEKLFIAFGSDGPLRNIYYSFQTEKKIFRLFEFWFIHALIAIVRLIKYVIFPPKKKARYIYFLWNISYIKCLFRIFRKYPGIYESIRQFRKNAEQKIHSPKIQLHQIPLTSNKNNPVLL